MNKNAKDYISLESKGSRTGKYKNRTAVIMMIVVHTVGLGLYKRWKRQAAKINKKRPAFPDYTIAPNGFREWRKRIGNEPYPFDTALRVYCSLMNAGPHFVICSETGRFAQVCSIKKRAWHVGGFHGWKGRSQLRALESRKFIKKCPWWAKKWPLLNSPLDFLSGKLWSKGYEVNNVSIGIEFTQWRDDPFRAPGEAAMASFEHIKLSIETAQTPKNYRIQQVLPVYTHSDVRPQSRTSRGKATDLREESWVY